MTIEFNVDHNVYALFDFDGNPVLTKGKNKLVHHSEKLLREIIVELKVGPQTDPPRFGNTFLLSTQLDQYENELQSGKWPDQNLLMELLVNEQAFLSMDPPEEIERCWFLEFAIQYLTANHIKFPPIIEKSYPLRMAEIYGYLAVESDLDEVQQEYLEDQRRDYENYLKDPGEDFDRLNQLFWNAISRFTLDHRLVLHTAFHLHGSLLLPFLLIQGECTLREYAVGILAVNQILPDMEMSDQEYQDELDKIAGQAALMITYLELSESEILKLIGQGEGNQIEFKSTLRFNLHTKKRDKTLEFQVLKEIVAFINTEGGDLLIGVDDKGKILGIQLDGFASNDKYLLHLNDLIKDHIGLEHRENLDYRFEKVRDKEVLRVICRKSKHPAYLDGDIYVRNAAQSIRLSARQAIEWQTGQDRGI